MNSVIYALRKLTFEELMPDGLVMIYGESGSGKTIFAQQYSHELLAEGGTVFWITTEELPATLRMGMQRFGWPTEKFELDGRLQIVDTVSSTRLGFSENMARGTLGIDPAGMLFAITDQLRKVNELTEPSKFLIVLDSISRLLLSCETKSVIDFVSSLSSRLENNRMRGMATITDTVHDKKILNALAFSSKGTIRFKIKDVDNATRLRQMRIETLRGRRHDDSWKSYRISDKGFDIEI